MHNHGYFNMLTETSNRTIYSVSDLNRDVKMLLDKAFPLLWIEGEISNFARPSSGHWYLSLKDSQAQVRGAMFKMRNRLVDFQPSNGMQVLVRARIGLYETRGDYQIIIEHMEEAGAGALQRAFETLKNSLQKEGLFDPAHKKTLPRFPTCIGVITSPTGAAIKDILQVLSRRSPATPVILYPVAVQGDSAAQEIVTAIKLASTDKRCDVLILARGGGSLEDLWAFNEEIIARAMHLAPLPIVTGIGHEIDFTIADFVADIRAPTPSAAAELVSPDQLEWHAKFSRLESRLATTMRQHLKNKATYLRLMSQRIQHPSLRLQTQAQRVDELEHRLRTRMNYLIEKKTANMANLMNLLMQHTPAHELAKIELKLTYLRNQLMTSRAALFAQKRKQLAQLSHNLNTVSPLSTLARGYSIIREKSSGKLVTHLAHIKPADKIEAKLFQGKLLCHVEELIDD